MPNSRNRYQLKPRGASCGWVQYQLAAGPDYGTQPYDFGSSYRQSTHPDRDWMVGGSASTAVFGSRFNAPGLTTAYIEWTRAVRITPPSSTWWTPAIVTNGSPSLCTSPATTDYLIVYGNTQCAIDIWRAHWDGLWTSSVAFTVETFASFSYTLYAGSGGYASSTISVNSGTFSQCGTPSGTPTIKTITFYDNGQVTIT